MIQVHLEEKSVSLGDPTLNISQYYLRDSFVKFAAGPTGPIFVPSTGGSVTFNFITSPALGLNFKVKVRSSDGNFVQEQTHTLSVDNGGTFSTISRTSYRQRFKYTKRSKYDYGRIT